MEKHDGSMRLDMALVERGLAPTRARARDAVRRGRVKVDGVATTRPALTVAAGAELIVDDPAARYVSRGALKLIAALDAFGFSPRDAVALDIGASTGGFTQVLLDRGAKRVHAIDVGHRQIDAAVAGDPRVVVQDGLNARNLRSSDIGEALGAIVADVSFISLRLVLPPALGLATPKAWMVALVKPQFEVGREHVGKGGIVRDAARAEAAPRDLAAWLTTEHGWQIVGIIPSPITGGDGNREFLVGARRG